MRLATFLGENGYHLRRVCQVLFSPESLLALLRFASFQGWRKQRFSFSFLALDTSLFGL